MKKNKIFRCKKILCKDCSLTLSLGAFLMLFSELSSEESDFLHLARDILLESYVNVQSGSNNSSAELSHSIYLVIPEKELISQKKQTQNQEPLFPNVYYLLSKELSLNLPVLHLNSSLSHSIPIHWKKEAPKTEKLKSYDLSCLKNTYTDGLKLDVDFFYSDAHITNISEEVSSIFFANSLEPLFIQNEIDDPYKNEGGKDFISASIQDNLLNHLTDNPALEKQVFNTHFSLIPITKGVYNNLQSDPSYFVLFPNLQEEIFDVLSLSINIPKTITINDESLDSSNYEQMEVCFLLSSMFSSPQLIQFDYPKASVTPLYQQDFIIKRSLEPTAVSVDPLLENTSVSSSKIFSPIDTFLGDSLASISFPSTEHTPDHIYLLNIPSVTASLPLALVESASKQKKESCLLHDIAGAQILIEHSEEKTYFRDLSLPTIALSDFHIYPTAKKETSNFSLTHPMTISLFSVQSETIAPLFHFDQLVTLAPFILGETLVAQKEFFAEKFYLSPDEHLGFEQTGTYLYPITFTAPKLPSQLYVDPLSQDLSANGQELLTQDIFPLMMATLSATKMHLDFSPFPLKSEEFISLFKSEETCSTKTSLTFRQEDILDTISLNLEQSPRWEINSQKGMDGEIYDPCILSSEPLQDVYLENYAGTFSEEEIAYIDYDTSFNFEYSFFDVLEDVIFSKSSETVMNDQIRKKNTLLIVLEPSIIFSKLTCNHHVFSDPDGFFLKQTAGYSATSNTLSEKYLEFVPPDFEITNRFVKYQAMFKPNINNYGIVLDNAANAQSRLPKLYDYSSKILAESLLQAKNNYLPTSKKAHTHNQLVRNTHENLGSFPSLQDLQTISISDAFDIEVELAPPSKHEGHFFTITLKPKDPSYFERPNQNFVFLIDRSGSIEKTRFAAFKLGVEKALQYVKEGDTFNIVFFDEESTKFSHHTMFMNASNKHAAQRFLQTQKKGYRFAHPSLYNILLETQEQALDSELPTSVFLLTNGKTLENFDSQHEELAELVSKNQDSFSLYVACASSQNNISMLEILASLNKGELMYSQTQAAFPRKIASLVKHSSKLIAQSVHINRALKTSDDVVLEFFPDSKIAPHIFSDKPYTIIGRCSKLVDFELFVQGKQGAQWLNIKKNISLKNARTGSQSVYKDYTTYTAYSKYREFLNDGDTALLDQAKKILHPGIIR